MTEGLGRARLQLLAAALLFSTGGAAIKATTLSSAQIAGFRSGVAVLAVLLLAPSARRLPGARAWLVGVAYAATVILYALANKLTTAANTIFLQSTAPLYVLLAAPWLLRERIARRDLGFVAVAAVGLALFFVGAEPPRTTAPDPATGNLLAAASGIAWAATIIGLRWMGSAPAENAAPIHAVVAGNTLAFAACLPFALPVVSFTPADAATVLYLGALQIALPYLFVAAAVRRLPALEISLVLLVEPVLNPLWAFALHGEVPGVLAMTGGAILLAATFAKAWLDARGS
ncbi:MAG TPA: DMT family transporter [Nannocystaceae bacterium]|nr:DMT family transporter [Nannocystaceae bacterium]